MKKNTLSEIQLFLTFAKEFILLAVLSVLFFIGMSLFNHQNNPQIWAVILFVFSAGKVYLLISNTFKKLDTLIKNNHKFNHTLLLLSIVISLIIISFTLDYLCASEIYTNAFEGIQQEQKMIYRFTNLLYYSIVTFSGVGYGDITPKVAISKLITVLEIITSFVMIVFIISKYSKKNKL
ncbi:MAG: two pore domain potassium channel family protein [Lutibacter sp.]|nr:two pore domain potassium channel family protein [Lutibacter sp.]